MRGEFIWVWPETWREIWLPLVNEEEGDTFCELYRAITPALKDVVGKDALSIPINDAIQFREAFELALALSGSEIALEEVHDAFDTSRATELQDSSERRTAAEAALGFLIEDHGMAHALLSRALSAIALDPKKRAEAKERAVDRIINDPVRSREVFEALQPFELVGERAVVTFLESAHDVLEDLGGDVLSNRYFNLVASFIEKFSLRYDLRRPCTLCPTLDGDVR